MCKDEIGVKANRRFRAYQRKSRVPHTEQPLSGRPDGLIVVVTKRTRAVGLCIGSFWVTTRAALHGGEVIVCCGDALGHALVTLIARKQLNVDSMFCLPRKAMWWIHHTVRQLLKNPVDSLPLCKVARQEQPPKRQSDEGERSVTPSGVLVELISQNGPKSN